MTTDPALLPRRTLAEVLARRARPVDPDALRAAEEIVAAVRAEGEPGVRRYAEQFGELEPGDQLHLDRGELENARAALDPETRAVLERTATRIDTFARAQRSALRDAELAVPGGTAGHRLQPITRVGCYAPGGRYPLPSSVLMTAITARAAGAQTVFVASPKPPDVVLAAAAIAGADGLLRVGGAHAIAALAYGIEDLSPRDIIVGPGGAYVTAAKYIVSRDVQIDMLAGPSELVVVADASADPGTVAADLLAQAEHDPAASVVLVCLHPPLDTAVRDALETQLASLPTREVAIASLERGAFLTCETLDEVVTACDAIAPEHLQLSVQDPRNLARRLTHYGGLFVGSDAPEVFGDYGFGPNHVLPTGGTARATAGLSVFTFLRAQTWLNIDQPGAAVEATRDAVALARLEGLEAHARAAERRLS